MKVLETVKKHPYLLGGTALAAIIIIWIATKSSNAGAVEMPATPQGSVETGSAMQVASMQAQSQANALQTQLQETQAKINGSIALADIQGKYGYQVAELQAAIAGKQIDAGINNSTLMAQVKSNELQYQRDITLGSFDAQKDITTINANLQSHMFDTLANITVSNQQAQFANAEQAWVDKWYHDKAASDAASHGTWSASLTPQEWDVVHRHEANAAMYRNTLVQPQLAR